MEWTKELIDRAYGTRPLPPPKEKVKPYERKLGIVPESLQRLAGLITQLNEQSYAERAAHEEVHGQPGHTAQDCQKMRDEADALDEERYLALDIFWHEMRVAFNLTRKDHLSYRAGWVAVTWDPKDAPQEANIAIIPADRHHRL